VTAYAAVVLAGGASRRMGRDKLAEAVGGLPLLTRAVSACAAGGADPLVVVGPARPDLPVPVVWAREEPPGGGPVPALAAGLAAVPADTAYAVVLAGDLPFVTPDDLRALRAALVAAPDAAGALAVDDSGREQPLLSAWRVGPLRARLREAEPLAGLPVYRTLAPLPRVRVELPPRPAPAWRDLDTPDDLAAAQETVSTDLRA
jgi:molybdopterin-guanine dinucleotide biosynthesis protein A